MRAATDDYLYEPDAVTVGIILFGTKVCSHCSDPLPANLDYFAPDRQNGSGLVGECRRCRREMERDRYGQQKEVISGGQLNLL